MKVKPYLKDIYQFFRKQGAKPERALDLTRAELLSQHEGWQVIWEDDPNGWNYLGEIDPETVKEVLSARLVDADGVTLQSLAAIIDPDGKYECVVEAELAAEELEEMGLL